jgi:hypothetical protein
MEREYQVITNCQGLADYQVRLVRILREDKASLIKWSDELRTNAYVSDAEKEARAYVLKTSVTDLWIGIARKLLETIQELHQAEYHLDAMKLTYPQYFRG